MVLEGLSPYAPATFTALGSTLASTGDILVGYKFALLGKALIEKIGVCESKAEVLFVVCSNLFMKCKHANNEKLDCSHRNFIAGQ